MNFSPLWVLCLLLLTSIFAEATANYEYGPNEYDAVMRGLSPDNKWAITTHGGGDFGCDDFHVYLTDNTTGKKVGPLEEITGTLDTGAVAFCAQWSPDSARVTVIYRVDRHEPLKAMSYRIEKHRAFPLSHAPINANGDQESYWAEYGSTVGPGPKIFGTPVPRSKDPSE